MAENVHVGHRQRMRDRCLKDGAGSFHTHELLEMLLYYCIAMKDTNPLAHKLLEEYGSLSTLLEADTKDLERRCAISENTALIFSIVCEIIKRCNSEKWVKKALLNTSQLAIEYAVSLLSYEKYECFYVISLDSQKRLINAAIIGKGTVNSAHVYPRLIVETALRYKADSVILAHNHPGGTLTPSYADITSTTNIVRILRGIDIEVVDHIIVGGNKGFSMADNSLIIRKEE